MGSLRTIALLAILVSFAPCVRAQQDLQPPGPPWTRPCVDWNLAALSPVIRERIHVSARSVPPFPNEDPRLRDPHAWETTTRIGWGVCSLRVVECGPDWFKQVRSLGEVSAGNGYCLYYEGAPWTGWGARRGPFYCWSSRGSERWLSERSWEAGDSIRSIKETYQYYPSGELRRHESRNESIYAGGLGAQGPYEWFDEVFAREGCLVACAYAKKDSTRASVASCYFLGKQVAYREFQERKADFMTRASP